MSFVNSICTMKGGTHVQHVTDKIVVRVLCSSLFPVRCVFTVSSFQDYLKPIIAKKNKGTAVKPFMIKNQLSV